MKSRLLALTILTAVVVAGCAHRQGNLCDGWKPLIVSEITWAMMSADERRDLVAHNEFGEKNCGWQPAQ